MKKIDDGFDSLLNSKYELYSIQLFELRDLAKSWYKDVDFKKFDNRFVRGDKEETFIEMKRTGIICNYFFAYREDDKYYLMDGFNRLFTDYYGKIDVDCTVYLKVLVDKLEDNQLMSAMFTLNLWKLSHRVYQFEIRDFFDRGFRLFIYSKFGIYFYNYDDAFDEKWVRKYTKEREYDDVDVLDYYFRNENDSADYFKHSYENVSKLFSQKNIVNDIREIVNSNNYLESPFKNYDYYLKGFIMFLSWKRVLGDNSEYKFKTYLDKLYKDKTFFKKLQGMSRTDCTRKNVYNFYREKKKVKTEPIDYSKLTDIKF